MSPSAAAANLSTFTARASRYRPVEQWLRCVALERSEGAWRPDGPALVSMPRAREVRWSRRALVELRTLRGYVEPHEDHRGRVRAATRDLLGRRLVSRFNGRFWRISSDGTDVATQTNTTHRHPDVRRLRSNQNLGQVRESRGRVRGAQARPPSAGLCAGLQLQSNRNRSRQRSLCDYRRQSDLRHQSAHQCETQHGGFAIVADLLNRMFPRCVASS